jgi:hypothetical protein
MAVLIFKFIGDRADVAYADYIVNVLYLPQDREDEEKTTDYCENSGQP